MRFFRETAESALRLEVDCEWLLADDASTDGTPAYLAELAGRSDRISLPRVIAYRRLMSRLKSAYRRFGPKCI